MPVDDDADDLAALEASPPPSPHAQDDAEAVRGADKASGASAAKSRMQQQRGDWYAAQQLARTVPNVAVTPQFVSGGALHSTSTKNKEVILPPTLTRAPNEHTGAGGEGEKATDLKSAEPSPEACGDGALFAPDARVCSRPVTEFSHLAVQKDGKTMSVLCLPWLYQKLQKDVLLLGRGDHADVHTDHPSCSRAHCEIRRVGLPDGSISYTLEDLHSAHGTLVNGGKIAPRKPVVLDDDDEVQVGFSQRLYTFRKGDDKVGLQRNEAPLVAVAPASSPQQPPPEESGDGNAKPSFLQRHIERRARLGGAFSRNRGGGFNSGDRHRYQQGWADSGDGAHGANERRQGAHEGSSDGRYSGGGGGGPLRRDRGGWQQSPYSPAEDFNKSRGPRPRSAFTGANTTPLGGSWGQAAPPYRGSAPEDAGCPPVPYSPAAGYPPMLPSPYQPSAASDAEAYGAYMTEAVAQYPPAAPPAPPPCVPSSPASAGFAKADRVYVHHILLKFSGCLNISGQSEVATLRDGKTPMQRTRDQAKQYLEQARQLLENQPGSFGDYAEELSDCPSYTRRGEVGWLLSNGLLESGELLFPSLMSAGALALNVGQLSPVLESHMGFHLFLRTA